MAEASRILDNTDEVLDLLGQELDDDPGDFFFPGRDDELGFEEEEVGEEDSGSDDGTVSDDGSGSDIGAGNEVDGAGSEDSGAER